MWSPSSTSTRTIGRDFSDGDRETAEGSTYNVDDGLNVYVAVQVDVLRQGQGQGLMVHTSCTFMAVPPALDADIDERRR
jgi:hypothetical protein